MEGEIVRGTLGPRSFVSLVRELTERRRTGTLHLASASHGDHAVVFQAGAPAKLRTSFPVPDLGLALVALGRLDDFDYRATFDLGASEATNAAELVLRGLVTDADIARARYEQRARALAALARRLPSTTTFFFAPESDDLPGEVAVPLAAADVLERLAAIEPVASSAPPRSVASPTSSGDPYFRAPAPIASTFASGSIFTQPSRPFVVAPPDEPAPPIERSPARLRYLALALGLVPLVVASLAPSDDLRARVMQTVAEHPEIQPLLERKDLTVPQLLAALPGHRIAGALLPADSHAHWLYAAVAALIWIGIVFSLFARGAARAKHLPLVGLFTGTAGILVLLGVQEVAELSQGVWLNGASILMLFFYVVKLIGFSYRAAMDPSNGFLVSFFGFTAGVGLCEEATKALPVIFAIRRPRGLDWRGAIVWGMASGVGFGVAEGVMYSSDFYNGLSTGGSYVTRFVSCVALHAIWSATCALALFEHQSELQGSRRWFEYVVAFIKNAIVPMVLHGLYDTLLKKGFSVGALAVAVVTFGWFALRLERVRRHALETEEALGLSPREAAST